MLLTLTLSFTAFAGVASAATDYSNVRVLLSTGSVTTLTMPVSGSYFIQENGASFSGGTLTVSSSGGKLVASHSSAGQLYSGSTINVMRQSITPSAGYIKVPSIYGSRAYLGHFTFSNKSGYVRCVNTVPMAHYLYGVVAYEMSNTFPLEALKAQAVAAKCYVLANMAPTSGYDIGDTSTDQVYKGYTSTYTNVINAVDATYDVGLYLGGRILCAYYAASNGGSTILPSDAWAGTNRYQWDSAFARTTDTYDVRNPESVQETAVFPYNGEYGGMNTALTNYLRSKAYAVLSSSGYLPSDGTVISIDAVNSIVQTADSYADVTLTVTMQDSGGVASQISFSYNFHMGELLSNGVFTKSQTLRLYTVANTGSSYTITRCRYGHGVGLSQRGAQQMGKEGHGYEQILRFYYPGATISSMGLAAPTDPVLPTIESIPTAAVGGVIGTAKTTSGVNMRSGPSTSYDKITKLSKNTTLNVYQQANGWSQCGNEKYTGWVSNQYLKITLTATDAVPVLPTTPGEPVEPAAPAPAAPTDSAAKTITAYGVVTSNTLNFRASPVNGTVLQKLTKNAQLNIYGAVENGAWYYCQYNGADGYVSASYVSLTSSPQQPSAPAVPEPTGSAVTTTKAWSGTVVNEWVRFRSTPDYSTQSNIIGDYAVGTALIIYAHNGEFYKVSPDGGTTVGYMHRDYVHVNNEITISAPAAPVSTVPNAPTASYSTGSTTANVYLRSKASSSGSILVTLKKGTSIIILGESGSYYQVQAGGYTGFIVKKYAKITGTTTAAAPGSAIPNATDPNAEVTSALNASSIGTATGSVRLRSSATTKSSSNILLTIPRGAQVTIFSKQGSWYYCSYNGTTGYAYASYVRVK